MVLKAFRVYCFNRFLSIAPGQGERQQICGKRSLARTLNRFFDRCGGAGAA